MHGAKTLVVGASGSVGFPLAVALARDPSIEVWGLARFTDPAAKSALQESGVRCVVGDLAGGDLGELPHDFTYVLNFSTVKSADNDWDADLDTNVGGLGFVMHHCRGARAVLHCSSTNVYKAHGHRAFRETDPLGDTPRPSASLATYTICKIASEAMARYCARQYDVPTTIARLNVPYGEHGGWPAFHAEMIMAGQPIPVHTNAPSLFNPIHHDDLVAMVPRLLDVASVPATVVNWGGDDAVSIEEWCAYIGTLVGREPLFVSTDDVVQSTATDLSKLHRLVGHTSVPWQEGMRRMVAHRYPALHNC
jgi:nucleoside-diphosphate-sugar epimerase